MVSARIKRGRRSITAVDKGGLIQVVDGECGDGARKEQCMNIKMVDVLLKVMDGECGDGVGKEHYCISKIMVGSLQEVKG